MLSVSVVQPRVLERHFHDLQKKYGAVLAADLVNTVSALLLDFELTLVLLFSKLRKSEAPWLEVYAP